MRKAGKEAANELLTGRAREMPHAESAAARGGLRPSGRKGVLMRVKENCRYALVAPTSMGVRVTPADRQPVHMSDRFLMTGTSAESNVLSVSSALGLPTKVLTAFVKGSPVARLIQHDLLRRRIAYEGPEVEPDGPWGVRHQFNIADAGFGARGPRVYNDRAGEVGLRLHVGDFDLERLFGQEGVAVLHLSGLFAALSPESGRLCLALADAAHKYGTRVSFDLNYRASFWKGREDELHGVFSRIAATADLLAGNEEDFQLCLRIPGPEHGGNDLEAKIESFQAMVDSARRAYPNAELFATTLRQVDSANRHKWGAMLLAEGEWNLILPRDIDVLDRIGGGDAFIGGLLYGLLRGWTPETSLQFGWATGALATTVLTDYAAPADEAQVWSIWEGNARVQR